jgi:hypothetical protein
LFHPVSMLPESLNDEIDVYHAGKFTPVLFPGHWVSKGAG